MLLLLLLPIVASLVPEIYNRTSPGIGGMPFFYWYQLAWIAGVAVCMAIVYLVTRSAVMPAYSLMLGFIALLGYMAISAANTFARDVYKPYIRKNASDREEGLVSQIVSVVLKLGAVGVIVGLKLSFAIELQLIGGVIVIQILPPVVLGLYTRWFHRWALLAGWVAGMGLSVYMLWITPGKTTAHFGGASFAFSTWGFDTKMTIWTGIVGVVANLVVATVLTPLLRRLPHGHDETDPNDYVAAGEPVVAVKVGSPDLPAA